MNVSGLFPGSDRRPRTVQTDVRRGWQGVQCYNRVGSGSTTHITTIRYHRGRGQPLHHSQRAGKISALWRLTFTSKGTTTWQGDGLLFLQMQIQKFHLLPTWQRQKTSGPFPNSCVYQVPTDFPFAAFKLRTNKTVQLLMGFDYPLKAFEYDLHGNTSAWRKLLHLVATILLILDQEFLLIEVTSNTINMTACSWTFSCKDLFLVLLLPSIWHCDNKNIPLDLLWDKQNRRVKNEDRKEWKTETLHTIVVAVLSICAVFEACFRQSNKHRLLTDFLPLITVCQILLL